MDTLTLALLIIVALMLGGFIGYWVAFCKAIKSCLEFKADLEKRGYRPSAAGDS